MRQKSAFLALVLLFTLLQGCNENQNEVKQFSKEGALETILTVDHLDNKLDVVVTTHQVWVKNQLVKKIVYRDTIPGLGVTPQTAENNAGESKTVPLPKEYEIYITVK